MNVRSFLRISLLAVMAASASFAVNISFTGTFGADDQVQLFDIVLGTAGDVTFQSYGSGGGANYAGATILAGGFDSYFTWYAGDGTQIGSDDDHGCGLANTTPNGCADAFFHGFLDAGNYVLALTLSGNVPNGALADGFSGSPGFSCSGSFCDVFGVAHTGSWAVDILTVDSASPSAAPEPATFFLVPASLALAGLLRRRKALL